MKNLLAGTFYEFEAERITSRPGAALHRTPGVEIGRRISVEEAFRQIKAGKSVYTPMKQDAYRLAMRVAESRIFKNRDEQTYDEPPHRPRFPTRSGRHEVYFQHYHPAGAHPSDHRGPGHVFFGDRGENFACE
jgi:hypothetical protein